MLLAKRLFNELDQERFAAASGDRNPMHMDALQARRMQAGAPVVHGVHLLLWALDAFSAAKPDLPPVRSIRAQFSKFVYLDQPVEVVLQQQDSKRARLSILVENTIRTKVTCGFDGSVEDGPTEEASSPDLESSMKAPMDLDLESIAGRSGHFRFAMTPDVALDLFPSATRWLGTRRVAALAASTYLVGMVCPGLYSIYNELSVSSYTEPNEEEVLHFKVTEADFRYRSVEQRMSGGGLIGTVNSFIRTRPVSQVPIEALRNIVRPTEFSGSVTLIVGGSRGLGELTAKIIGAGGGRVIITWNRGKMDADRVADEIRAAGGSCEILPYDARRPAAEQLASLTESPTHFYYFATPHIFRPESEIFAAKRLDEFLDFYVRGFWELARALRDRQPGISMFYPSSVYVTDRPAGMTEYSMAKAAGETLCADINQSWSPAKVLVRRLPRLPTDQTASVSQAEEADSVETMLPIVREVQSSTKSTGIA
jgi:acyl dehydratase